MLINVNLDKHNFDSFAEIIKMKNALLNVIKNKLSDNDELITRLSIKLKKYITTFQNIIVNHNNNYENCLSNNYFNE